MAKQMLALALCRVSTPEQLENNSLNRQHENVLRAAEELGVTIPEDGWWSGNVSSKRGTNVERTDLKQVIDRCKKDKRVKYVIVDEPDRFMRSIDEAAYFEVTFNMLDVRVWYASDPELNKGDLASKLLKFTKYLSAEGSNEERQFKSINGQTTALKEGRYTFSPKPGYIKGTLCGIQELHPVRGPALRTVLIRLATRLVTPSQALLELNNSDFMVGHSLYKMDKFRKIATDPFYAGILDMDKQVKVYNENGLHEPLITKEQHLTIVRIMDGKTKNQAGPRKNGNPKYPLNNMVNCDQCLDQSIGRVVGFDHGNGKPSSKVWEKYRCRSCGRYITRQALHAEIEQRFKDNPVTVRGRTKLMKALDIVWRQRENEAQREATRVQHKITSLSEAITNQVESATMPENASIKDEILAAITKKKDQISELEDRLDSFQSKADEDRDVFLKFAFDFVDNMGPKFLDISQDNRLRCKQIVFPGGFYWNEDQKVLTPRISELITLAATKKDAEASDLAHVVRVMGL